MSVLSEIINNRENWSNKNNKAILRSRGYRETLEFITAITVTLLTLFNHKEIIDFCLYIIKS